MAKMKRALPALMAALLLFMAACAPQIQEQPGVNTPGAIVSPGALVSPGAVVSPGLEVLEPGSAKGRYMETPFDLELPEGEEGLTVLGISQAEGAIEIFSMNEGDWETENPTYYRHTLSADGAQTIREEPWLNEHMKLGNQMLVVRGGDGLLYASYADFDEEYNLFAHIIVSRDNEKTGEELSGGGIEPLEMIEELAAPLKSDMTLNAMLEPELTALFEGAETPESAAAKLFSKLSAYRSE